MTRKRYVKLMMARGFDRNGAQIRASLSVNIYGSYERAFADGHLLSPFSVPDFAFLKSALDTMVSTMAEILRAVMPALASCLRAVADSIDPEVPDA